MMTIVGVLIGIHVLDNMIGKHMSKRTKNQVQHTVSMLGQDDHDRKDHHDHFRDDFKLNKEQTKLLCDGVKDIDDGLKVRIFNHLSSTIKQSNDTDKSNSVIADVLNKAD